MWEYNNTEELYHYGILGQKWGVRRYQNKDGSLTPAGKKKAAKLKKQYKEITGKPLKVKKKPKVVVEDNDTSVNLSRSQIKRLSNSSLQARIERLQNEKRAMELQQNTASGKDKFIRAVGKQVLAPAAAEAGKEIVRDLLKKSGRKLVGLDTKTEKEVKSVLDDLKREVESLEFEKRKREASDWLIKDNKKREKDNKKREKRK